MRVLHVINSLHTGGAEKLVTDTVPLYNSRGIQTDVLLLNGAQTPFMGQLAASGCNVYSLGTGSTYNPLLIFKIIPYLKRYDVVHVHLFPAQYWVATAKRLSFSKTKLVYTEHSTSSRRMRKPGFKIIDPFFYGPYNKIICIAEDVRKSVVSHLKISEKKLAVILNGADIKKVYLADELDKSAFFPDKKIKIIIQVSSFHFPKDQSTLIRALHELPEHIKLLLVGEGLQKADCIALAQELGLLHRVLFLGIRMDVPQLLKTADVIVLSSKYEGLSLSSIEGMAAGRPFIASNVPGLSNIVGGAGILFPYEDHKELAQQINKLFDDHDYYSRIAQQCSARATQYDINAMVDKHIELYNSL